MIASQTPRVVPQRTDGRRCFLPPTAHGTDASETWRHSASDDQFATTWRSVHTATIPLPLLLSAGQFPVSRGRYEILRLLGEGQMGSVFLARDLQLDRQVAVKVSKFSAEPGAIDRFTRETRAMGRLEHPNICPIYDYGEWDGARYFTMPFIDGQTLAETLARRPPLSSRRVAVLVRQLAIALDTAHQSGITHRDLKPANIMIKSTGAPVIIDFGLAESEERGASVTKQRMMLGTPAYMAPEQVLGTCEAIGPPSDIYSLGVIMYQILTGRVPFDGTLSAVLEQVASERPLPPSHFNPEVDRKLEAICLKAMSKSLTGRISTALDFADALDAYLGDG